MNWGCWGRSKHLECSSPEERYDPTVDDLVRERVEDD